MASALSFTPITTYAYNDAGLTLKVTIDYSEFPDYSDFSALTVKVTKENAGGSTTLDIFSDVVSTMSGSVTATSGDSTLTGTGTAFTTEINAGDYITFGDDTSNIYLVKSITSDTVIVLSSGLASSLTSSSITKYAKEIYVTADDLGGTAGYKLDDDVYTFIYTFTFSGTTDEEGTYTVSQALSCNLSCYVDALIADIPAKYSCVPCDNDYLIDTAKTFFYYKALVRSSYNGTLDEYNDILSGLCDIKDLTSSSCGC